MNDVALVRLPSHDAKKIIAISLNHAVAVAVYTNLLRETDSDLTEAGTPLSQASWLELLPTRQSSSPGI